MREIVLRRRMGDPLVSVYIRSKHLNKKKEILNSSI